MLLLSYLVFTFFSTCRPNEVKEELTPSQYGGVWQTAD
jgi:hypothetical protein